MGDARRWEHAGAADQHSLQQHRWEPHAVVRNCRVNCIPCGVNCFPRKACAKRLPALHVTAATRFLLQRAVLLAKAGLHRQLIVPSAAHGRHGCMVAAPGLQPVDHLVHRQNLAVSLLHTAQLPQEVPAAWAGASKGGRRRECVRRPTQRCAHCRSLQRLQTAATLPCPRC